MKHDPATAPLVRVLGWVGLEPTPRIIEQCSRFKELLATEGVTGGVIGPNEVPKLWSRHLADSACFLAAAEGSSWLDVGSGGGLPGIPLAICRPDVLVTLLDRSGRRIDAVRRWVRVLDLANVEVLHADVHRHRTTYDTLFFRGSLDLVTAIECTNRLARGAGVFGFSHAGSPPPESLSRIEAIEVPPSVLDSGVTLLRITP